MMIFLMDWSVGEEQESGGETETALLAIHQAVHPGMGGAGKPGSGSYGNTGLCLVVRMENWYDRASGGET